MKTNFATQVCKISITCLVLLQTFLSNVISFLPATTPEAMAFSWPSDISVSAGASQSCSINKNYLIYQGTDGVVLSDLYVASSATKFHTFDDVGGSKVKVYNPYNVASSTTFQAISNAKFKGTSQVTWTYGTIDIVGHKPGNSRNDLAAQFVYILKGTIFDNMIAGSNNYQQVTDFNNTNGSHSVESTGNKAGQGGATPFNAPDECVNVYVAFCGDGKKDTTGPSVYEGTPSSFGNIQMNGNEACDNGAQNDGVTSVNGVICSNTCQVVTPPTPGVCTSLTVTPGLTGNNPYTIGFECAGTNVTGYSIKVNGTQINTNAVGNYTFNTAGTYNIQCFVNGQTSTPTVCTKSIVVSNPPANPVCSGLTLTPPNGGTAPFNLGYSCQGANSTNFNVFLTNTAGAERESNTANGNFTNLPAGSYTATCSVGGATSPACTKSFTVTTPPVTGTCSNLQLVANPGNITINNGIQTIIPAFPITSIVYSTQSTGTPPVCQLIELVNNVETVRQTKTGANGTFTYTINAQPNNPTNSNVFWVKCFVNGQMPNGTTNTCNMDFWFVKNVPPVIAPDLTITKDVTPTVVSSGDLVTYTIVVTHNGPAGAVNVKSWKLEDTLPAGQIRNAGYTSAAGNGNKCGNLSNITQGPTNVVANIVGANLAVGESCTYTLKAKVVNSSPSTQTNNICVTTVVGSGNINETNTSNNCDDATVTVNQPVPAFCNGITVSANGTQLIHANNGVNTVNFPASISYNLNRTGTSLSCMLKYGPNMTVLSTVNNASNGTFTPPVNGTGTYRVSCKLNGTIDPRIAGVNECSFDLTIVPTVVHTIDLELDKRYTDGGQSCQTYNSGDLVNYVIEVTNRGTTGVTNFTVKDYIPAGFAHVAGGTANGSTVTFTYPGTLAPNQSTTFNLTVKALGATNPEAYNKAEVCNYNGMNSNTNPKDPDSNPCDMTSVGTPDQDDEDQLCTVVVNPITPTIDIELNKSLSDPSHTMFNSGETITFNVVVSNHGTTGVINASVKDYLPALALTNVVASNGGIVNGNIVTWNGINLAPGQSITFTITAKTVYNSTNPDPCNKAEAGNYEIAGGVQDPDSNGFTMGVNGNPTEDDEDKVCFWVNQPEPDKFDIELTKTLTTPATSIVSGGFVGFKIRVYNNSNVTIPAGYQVKDQRPNNIQFISASNGGVYSAPIVTRTLNAPLAAFSEVNLYVTGKVLSAGWYDNCAEAGSYNGSNSTNNPRDIDSDPFNHPGQDVEDDESCVGFDVPTPNNPTTCDSITVNPTTGSVPLTVTYNCNATNATTYTVQLIQNGVATNIGTAPIGTYTITNPGAYTIKCLVNNTITSPTCQTPINAGVAPFIDLNIKKLFADNNSSSHVNFNSGDTISFKLIVGNSGNTTATNFTVKDYLPASLQFVSAVPTQASITPNGMGNTITWNIASLAPGATTTITVNAKIIEALRDKNKTEVCDYEENGEPQDPDSAPCNMGPGGTPNEDDEDLVMWDVNDPSPSVTCDSLTATPLSGTVPYNVNYTCAGQGATSYVVKIFGGNLGVNGLVVGNTAAGSFTMTYSGNYTLQCFVNGTTTSSACNKNIIGTPPYIPPSTGTKCNYITVNPNGGNSPLNVNFFCNGGYSGTNTNFPLQYVVNVSGPNGFNQSYITASGNVLLSGAGNYSFSCSVNGATATACNKNVNVVNPSCPNGALNPPACNECPVGYILSGGICVLDCPIGQILSGGQCIPCPTCIPDCGTGYTFTGGQCVLNPCTNGAINPPNCTLCPAGTTYTGGQCITNTGSCTNGATNYPACNSCPIGKIFSGNQCITPPNPNGGSCDVQCLNLTAQGTAAIGQSISFTCNKSGGNTTQILISLNGNTVATLQGPTANYTFNTAGNYTAQCLVDNSVDYKCDYFKNYCLAPLQCAYKIKPTGGMCAVQATLAPYQTQVIPPSFRVTMPAPVEYCTANEVATLPCHDNSNLPNYGVVRNHDVCKQTFTISGSNQCTNGATNYPACNSCAAGYTRNGSSCVISNCTNGATNPPACNSCPAGYTRNGVSCVGLYCLNGATNYPACNSCAAGYTRNGSSCVISNCTNGATNYPACNSCAAGYTRNGSSCVISNCTNGATNPPYCNSCPSGYSLINGVCTSNGGGGYNPQPFAYCGNGRQEIGEYCDYKASNVRQSDYIITDGPYKGKKCEMNCRIENETDAPKCMDIDPPSINEGEQFPFRWNIDNSDTKVVTSCSSSSPDTVLKSSMQCFFNVYNGKRGTTDPVIKDIKLDCYNQDNNFNTTLMSYWNTKSSDADGRKVVTFDKGTTNGIYGEYKIELSKIEYATCDAPSAKKVFDDRVCQYNFVVGEGYMIQKGANISTLKDTSIIGYYGFGSNTPRFDLYLKGVQQSLTLANFDATRNMNYISTDFVSKYSELATNAGVGVSKVPGKDIYIYDSSVTLDDSDLKDLSTIIVKNGNLRIEGTVAKNILYVVPNGTIEFGGDANCDKYTDDALPQVVQGIFVAGQGFASDNYLNTNSNKSRCHNGGLKIRGTLIGKGVETLIEKRRVVLNDWFQGAVQQARHNIFSTEQVFSGTQMQHYGIHFLVQMNLQKYYE